jgi:hypothetical protein
MAWFRRGSVTLAVNRSSRHSPGTPTSQLCSERGCLGADRVVCDYQDRRGRSCPTAWCPAHIVVVGEWHLCRRHARLVKALAPREFRGWLPAPDLANRSPSLAAYLAEAFDPHIRRILGELLRPDDGEQIGIDPLIVTLGRSGTRRWTEAWKLYDNTGPLLRISVEVDETRDPEAALRLNGRIILRWVPPWIAARRAGATGPEQSAEARDEFARGVIETHVRPALLDEERWMRRFDRQRAAIVAD